MLQLIPAIDLKDGHCVRLKGGDMEQSTTFSTEPEKMAAHWLKNGARRLHVVDLNGAFVGKPQNRAAIANIIKQVGNDIPVQLGGGIRHMETIELYLDMGVRSVIIGTAAAKNPGFLQEACAAFPNQIIAGLDAKDGRVATDGWSKISGHEAIDMAKKWEDYGIECIIYTDIGRDGLLTGLNLEATQKMAEAVSIPIFASGGLSRLEDIKALCALETVGVAGVICGRAIYSGEIDFSTAQKLADSWSEGA